MAKQRMINTRFWIDSYVSTLDPIERLVFLYLLTNSNTNICGIYEIPIRRIAFDIGIDSLVAQNIIERLERDGKIIYRQGWVAIKNFIKHQAINPKVQAGINYELKDKPKELVKFVDIQQSVPKERIKRKKISKTMRNRVLDRCDHRCIECKESDPINLEIDHIKPVVMGGTDDFENLQILCRVCNGKKNAQLRWNKRGQVEYSVPTEMGSLSHSNTNSNSNTNLNKQNTSSEETSQEIPELIKAFEKVNPACNRFYGNKTQRQACQDLIDTYGFDRTIFIIEKTLPTTNGLEFFPTIITPVQLRDKWASLESAVKKKQSELKTNKNKYEVI